MSNARRLKVKVMQMHTCCQEVCRRGYLELLLPGKLATPHRPHQPGYLQPPSGIHYSQLANPLATQPTATLGQVRLPSVHHHRVEVKNLTMVS